MDTKQIYENIYKPDGFYDDSGRLRDALDETVRQSGSKEEFLNNLIATDQYDVLSFWLTKLGIEETKKVIEIGCGVARHCNCHPNWQGLSILARP